MAANLDRKGETDYNITKKMEDQTQIQKVYQKQFGSSIDSEQNQPRIVHSGKKIQIPQEGEGMISFHATWSAASVLTGKKIISFLRQYSKNPFFHLIVDISQANGEIAQALLGRQAKGGGRICLDC